MGTFPQTASQLSTTLRTKLVLSTAAVLIVASLLLGGLFIQQQTRSASESLVQSGVLLAQHLASMGRFSIMAGDTHRLDQLIQELLSISPVAYATVVTSSGELQAGFGKETWQQQFFTQSDGRRQFSVTKLIQFPRTGIEANEPVVNGIWLTGDGPILRRNTDFTLGELFSLMGGLELPLFYDLVVEVSHYSHSGVWDPALQLTLEDRLDQLDANQGGRKVAPALVQIGLSTSHLQHTLRRLLGKAAFIIATIITAGLLAAVLLARRITTPLRELTHAATKLAAGEIVPDVAIRTRDEIGTLTRMFNLMTSTLQTREQELRELTHSLEDRVVARTEELAAANAKLRELDRRKSVFVSTASHELRTPLTSMKVHLANLRDGIDGAVTDDQRQSLLRMDANLSRLQTLIEELLDLSQIEMGQARLRVEPLQLPNVIAKTVEDLHPFSSERRVKIMVSLPIELPSVSADSGKLHQIFLNLLHNAVKFTPMDTIVDVTVVRRSDEEVQISVRDVGPGIAPEDLEKVFQPFYRAPTTHKRAKGTGLGLAITKLLVELHHGRLWVETEVGQGSCFSLTLPISTSVALRCAETQKAAPHYQDAV